MDREMTDLFRKARALKTAAVRKPGVDGDVPHLVDVYRQGSRVARLAAVYTEDVLTIMYQAPGACCADRLVLAVDTWASHDQTNPITGKQWEFGDMDRMAHDDLAVRRGMLSEAIGMMSFRRAGVDEHMQVKYSHDRDARKIKWDEPEPFLSEGGRYPRIAGEGFERDTIIDETIKLAGHPPPEYDLEALIRKASVSWVHKIGDGLRVRVMEGPKGPGLLGVGPDARWN